MKLGRCVTPRAIRASCACVLLWACMCAWPAKLARVRLEQLPDIDFALESRLLREQGRLGEAALVVRAGLARSREPDAELLEESRRLDHAQSSWSRRAGDAMRGALTGKGETASALVGSMSGDLLGVGDMRDLLIEAGKGLTDDNADEVMIALSALGLGTTAAPYADWAPSLLKWLRKRGALGDPLALEVVALARDRSVLRGASLLWDVGTLARRASPGGAASILTSADSIADVRRLARCSAHHEHGAFALVATGDAGRSLLTDAPTDGHAAALERSLIAASFKGQAGAIFLRTPQGRALRTPHPLARGLGRMGLVRPARWTARGFESLDGMLIVLIPMLGAWVLGECALAWRAMRARVSAGTEKAR